MSFSNISMVAHTYVAISLVFRFKVKDNGSPHELIYRTDRPA